MSSRRQFFKSGILAAAAGLLGGRQASAQSEYATAKATFPADKSYAATAKPRPWTLPQRPTAPISIDIHCHWAPEGYLKAKADLGQPDTLDPINYDMARRCKLMDAAGVQAIVMTLGGFRPWGWVTPDQGAHIARVTNDAAIAAHAAFPERIFAGIELNCSDPVGSLAELNRVAGKPGLVFVHLPTSLASREFLFEPAFAPVLARCEELGLPIFLHPLDGEANWFAGKRLADAYSGADSSAPNGGPSRFPGLTNGLGNSLEMGVCLSKLIVNGTLDKYPTLTFIASGGGGAIPYVAGRLENRTGKLQRPVYEYLRRFYYDSLVYWPPSLRYLAEMVGSDRIMMGTDNQFGPGNGIGQPNTIVDQADFADQDRDLILRGNAKRLLKI